MNQASDQHANLGWLNVLPLIVIVAMAVALWRPAPDRPPTLEQEEKIADLAMRLGSRSSTAADIDDRLRSFGPFPPDAHASQTLAETLVTCGTISLDESQRRQLARHLYGITVIGDNRAQVPAAIIGIQQLMAAVGPGCSPGGIERTVRAARDVATADPRPRRDWW